MCVSQFPASFIGTHILIHEPNPMVLGHPTRVMLYQNNTQNLHHGPNAMLLHIDALTPMGPDNFIATTQYPNVMKDMVTALTPRTRSGLGTLSAKGVQVFDVGIYTVILAQNAATIPAALDQVPLDKRPAVNQPLFDWYGIAYPHHTVALCCFSASAESEPLMFHWEPRNPNQFIAPALDEHTGGIPDWKGMVSVDHWILASSYRIIEGGEEVHYRDWDRIPEEVRALLPLRVIGRHYSGMMTNGDFAYPLNQVLSGQLPTNPYRLKPFN
jgi:hypothetical protein